MPLTAARRLTPTARAAPRPAGPRRCRPPGPRPVVGQSSSAGLVAPPPRSGTRRNPYRTVSSCTRASSSSRGRPRRWTSTSGSACSSQPTWGRPPPRARTGRSRAGRCSSSRARRRRAPARPRPPPAPRPAARGAPRRAAPRPARRRRRRPRRRARRRSGRRRHAAGHGDRVLDHRDVLPRGDRDRADRAGPREPAPPFSSCSPYADSSRLRTHALPHHVPDGALRRGGWRGWVTVTAAPPGRAARRRRARSARPRPGPGPSRRRRACG